MARSKINRQERVAQVLLHGKPVSPDQIIDHFKDTDQEHVMYKLSWYIYKIKCGGGIIRVEKDGRKIKTYQLVNFDQFDSNGRFVINKPTKKSIVKENERESEFSF